MNVVMVLEQQNTAATSGTTIWACPSEKTTDPLVPVVRLSPSISPCSKRNEEKKWDDLLTSPASLADSERMRIKIETDTMTEKLGDYLSDDQLEELF